jgi:cytochrome b561
LLKNVHIALNYTLLVLVALHVAAALKHQLLDRDGLLSRMLPFIK